MHLALTPSSNARCPDPNSTHSRTLCLSHTQSRAGLLSIDLLAVPHLRPATASCRRRRSFEQPPSAHSLFLHRAAAIDINLPLHRAAIATFLCRAATPSPKVLFRKNGPVRSPFEGSPPLLLVLVTRYLCLPLACSIEGFF
ncbi:uncharacterized protein DS421_7g207590 [Arachis hypogaea]|nr:uncharacterized protein DS421_7g207590 [Arachis hypogaea]